MKEEIKRNTSEDEIDLIALVKTIWNGRKYIIKIVFIFMGIGLAVALLSTNEYTASTTMVPQVSNGTSKMGGLSSIAAMAGFNMDMNKGSSELSPVLYPQILNSVSFQLEIMNSPFIFPNIEKPTSIYEYYTEYHKSSALQLITKYTIGLPRVLLNAAKNSSPQSVNNNKLPSNLIQLTKEQEEVRSILTAAISLEVNDKDGFLTLYSRSINAGLAAQVGNKAIEILQQYITDFKIEKASAQLKFIEERYIDNKKEFEFAQATLANFRDKNKNITSARARTQEDRLQSEYQLAFDVYSELAKQMEQARIQVKEDTPIFSIIKPVTVPLVKSKPNRPMILMIWTFLGGIVAIGWILGKEFLVTIKKRWKEEE